MVEGLGSFDDFSILKVSVLRGVFQASNQHIVVGLKSIKLDLQGTVTLSRSIQILYSGLEVGDLLTESVVLS